MNTHQDRMTDAAAVSMELITEGDKHTTGKLRLTTGERRLTKMNHAMIVPGPFTQLPGWQIQATQLTSAFI